MAEPYRVIGAEESPYSVKVRTWFRYKGIPHRWMGRAAAGKLYERHARLPLVPLVVTPDDRGIQDSTPIIETLEPEFPEPGIHPDDPVAAFVSALLEEFGDEWGNKWMFHFRWAREVDQIACARRLAASMGGGLGVDELETAARSVVERMVNRVWFVGSNAATAPQIEQSFQDAIGLLERHLIGRPYLFGGRPAFADFGLWGQIYNARRDPTPAAIVATAPRVNQWIDRMLLPTVEGEFESWSALAPTLTPLLKDQVGALFLPWERRQRRGHRGRRGGVHGVAQGQRMDAEAAEIPRPVARGAEGEVRVREGHARATRSSGRDWLSRGAGSLKASPMTRWRASPSRVR